MAASCQSINHPSSGNEPTRPFKSLGQMALIALLDYKIHHHIPRSKRRVLRGTCPPSGLMAQGTRPPRDMSTKWTLGPRHIHLSSHSPRRMSSEARIYQAMGSPPKSHPVKGFVPFGMHPPR
ncbi:hypothetical protein ACOSQ3_016426 [Xanthoceras sorbifolium]